MIYACEWYLTGGQVLDSDLPADDDDLLGHRGGRVVPPAHGDEAGGELGGVCREGEARDRQEGRTGRAPVGRKPEEEQGWIHFLFATQRQSEDICSRKF